MESTLTGGAIRAGTAAVQPTSLRQLIYKTPGTPWPTIWPPPLVFFTPETLDVGLPRVQSKKSLVNSFKYIIVRSKVSIYRNYSYMKNPRYLLKSPPMHLWLYQQALFVSNDASCGVRSLEPFNCSKLPPPLGQWVLHYGWSGSPTRTWHMCRKRTLLRSIWPRATKSRYLYRHRRMGGDLKRYLRFCM